MKQVKNRSTFIKTIVCFLLLIAGMIPIRSVAAQETTEDLLSKVQRDSINYFLKYSHPKTGLIPDSNMPHAPASIAATGFSLIALVVAAENQWLTYDEAYDKVKRTLFTLQNKVQHERGFFYHFISTNSGKRIWESEASSIDTALCVASALIAGQYFKDTIVEKLARSIYERVEWDWMLNNTHLFCHGYKPESGFLPYYWDTYSEHLILHVLSIGALRHTVPSQCWSEWTRLEETYNGLPVIFAHSGSLFTYQFSHMFVDFRELSDNGIDYFTNSKNATLANRAFCINSRDMHPTYGENIWGLSASLGPRGYKAYGARPGRAFHDGTIAPYAILSALPFCEEEALRSITYIYENYKDNVYSQCGFRDAFNLEENWVADHYIGIDQGITVGMIENYRSELIWRLFMELPSTTRWIERCNLIPDHQINPHTIMPREQEPV
ncbi:MAG: hypothetical protein JW938_05925 [Candidatus Omnitrophica bacterium]|nr:hypothetical protein [Candidatus Omnitrophota bacterium]